MNSYLCRTFEYVAPSGGMTAIETRIPFSCSAGSERSHPRGHYDRATGS
jgi:hypothetical protein